VVHLPDQEDSEVVHLADPVVDQVVTLIHQVALVEDPEEDHKEVSVEDQVEDHKEVLVEEVVVLVEVKVEKVVNLVP